MTERRIQAQKPEQSANDADALAALKSLLLGEEKQQLETISERLDDHGLRSEDVADVLADSLRISGRAGDDLADAMEKPVTTCIQRTIERDPGSFADALYPVMGPAIRQSIASTLKGLVENINRTLEHSLSIQGFKWRLEAMRSGVPFAEVLLRHTLAYRVEQIFLIQKDSGLLMQHVHHDLAADGDVDAVSGMLTAIAQFVRDAFRAGEDEGLESVEIGDHTVLLVHGPHAYMACVVRGIPPNDLRKHAQHTMENIYRKFARQLKQFNGDPDSLQLLRPQLESCLLSEQKPGEKRRGLAPASVILLLLILGGLAWGSYLGWQEHQAQRELAEQREAFVEALRQGPGIVITETRQLDDSLLVRGLHDPLAKSPAILLSQTRLNPEQVELDFKPYIDASPDFALTRARDRLAAPEGVQLSIDRQGGLQASGIATSKWIERARLLAPGVPGVNGYNDENLRDLDSHVLQQAVQILQPPAGVQLLVQDAALQIRGHAPLQWIAALDSRLSQVQGLESFKHQLQSSEQREFDLLQQSLRGARLFFVEGAIFDEDQLLVAQDLAQKLLRLSQLGAQLGYDLHVMLVGRTDGLGLPTYNEQLAAARALSARDYLVMQGLPAKMFHLQTAVGHGVLIDPALRRVDISILLNP